MSEFAPYHVVRMDESAITTLGKFFNLELALPDLRFQNRHFPEEVHLIIYDGGVLTEREAEALLLKRASSKFHIVRRVA